jgi:hypothetical protein
MSIPPQRAGPGALHRQGPAGGRGQVYQKLTLTVGFRPDSQALGQEFGFGECKPSARHLHSSLPVPLFYRSASEPQKGEAEICCWAESHPLTPTGSFQNPSCPLLSTSRMVPGGRPLCTSAICVVTKEGLEAKNQTDPWRPPDHCVLFLNELSLFPSIPDERPG